MGIPLLERSVGLPEAGRSKLPAVVSPGLLIPSLGVWDPRDGATSRLTAEEAGRGNPKSGIGRRLAGW